VGFTLDLIHWTGTRSQGIRQIEFWKPEGRRQLRRTGLVYALGRESAPAATTEASETPRSATPSSEAAPVDWSQEPLPFEDDEAA
jgi:hypothetical protein